MRRTASCVLACLMFVAAASGDDAASGSIAVDPLDRLLQAVAAGEEVEADAASLVPQLMQLVTHGNPQESSLTIRALAVIGPDAAPAVALLCEKLNDSVHANRGFAVETLVAIGEASIDPLREVLTSPSGRARAAATSALHRLRQLELNELTSLAADGDPRMRASVANALADFGEPGVAPLAQLLGDPETAVAVQAADSLIVNHTDASTAMPVLIDALTRPDVAWVAAEALGAYGIEAQRAIPALIQHLPLEPYGWEENRCSYNAGYALSHIGPPHADDVAALTQLVLDENCEIRLLATDALALMGTSAASAADTLEAGIFDSLDRERQAQREAEMHPDDEYYDTPRWSAAAEEMLAALWHVTHDAPRFVSALERHAVESQVGLYFYAFDAFDDGFTSEDCLLLEPLLRSPNVHVRKTALTGVGHLGEIALPLKDALIDMARTDDGRLTNEIGRALGAIGPGAAGETVPVLVDLVRHRNLEMIQFAYAIQRVEQGTADVDELLSSGIEDGDEYTARECVSAMIAAATDSEENAARIIELTRRNRDVPLAVAEGLGKFQSAPEIVIPHLVALLSHSDYWTRHNAARSLGDFGPAAADAVDELEMRMNVDEGSAVRLQAAKAIFLITGDVARFEQVIQTAFQTELNLDRHQALERIIELGPQAEPFVTYLVDELNSGVLMTKEELIEGLGVIGTPEAVAAIEDAAQSTDWVLRSPALQALQAADEVRNE